MANQKTIDDRLFEVRVLDNDCWEWQGYTDKQGYGFICVRRDGKKTTPSIHRYFYENLVGEIPDGAHLDHTCHNKDESCPGGKICRHRRCANPDHLEPVTPEENILRGKGEAAKNAAKTHCPEGHEYSDENTYIEPKGGRQCITCRKVTQKKHYDTEHGGDRQRAYARERMRELRKDPEYKLKKNAWERERYHRKKALAA
jgi:hypothetical protein